MFDTLMCKNTPVYDIAGEKTLCFNLLPGIMRACADSITFNMWMKSRYSSNTNAFARRLKGTTFGQGNRASMNEKTFALSLSDCYWVTDKSLGILFEQISPYYADFWKGEGLYSGGSVPTLYVNGFISKQWLSKDILYKHGCLVEYECYKVCSACGVKCARIELNDDNTGIYVSNITDIHNMLEPADISGRIDPDDFTDTDIADVFGLEGLKMIAVDAIFGNGDRHAGNFGFIRDSDGGEYKGMCPLYDFDHALDAKGENDILLGDLIALALQKDEYRGEALRIARTVIKADTIDTFRRRAKVIIDKLN